MSLGDREPDNQLLLPLANSWTTAKSRETSANVVSSIETLSPASLAYLGDAVYELFIRSHYLLPPRRISDYHKLVVAQVRAERQAACLQALKPHLSEREQEMARRGRNAVTSRPRRLSGEIYHQATSFETLIGYLYLKNPQRLNQLLETIKLN